jgi:uroporphyrinogen decarboxylase
MAYEPLKKKDVVKAIKFDRPARVPMVNTHWWGEGLGGQYGDRLQEFAIYPQDAVQAYSGMPGFDPRDHGYWWKLPRREADPSVKRGNDSTVRLVDWDDLKCIEADPPDTEAPGILDRAVKSAKAGHDAGMYVLLHHWGLMFESVWGFRGMENLLTDYHENPKEIHRLHRLITDTELRFLDRAIRETKPDGFFHSDDFGFQTGPLISPEIFREFIKPYYREVYDFVHGKGLDIWLHTCGCVTELIDDLVDVGLDVIHPIQKHTMDAAETVRRWRGKIAFWPGMDVQQTLRFGTPDDVRAEVRLMMDTFDLPEGGMCIASGNGIVAGTPFENIRAYLDESYHYGGAHRERFAKG